MSFIYFIIFTIQILIVFARLSSIEFKNGAGFINLLSPKRGRSGGAVCYRGVGGGALFSPRNLQWIATISSAYCSPYFYYLNSNSHYHHFANVLLSLGRHYTVSGLVLLSRKN